MDVKMSELLERMTVAIEKQNGIPVWDIVINVIPWIGVLITIGVLLMERCEKRRPYLEVSFELIRSTLACLVIRNVGDVPARLKSLQFNSEFLEQLDDNKIQSLKRKSITNVTIFPKRYWVLSLDKNIFDVIKFSNTELKVEYTYSKIRGRKRYKGVTVIDFKEYESFLLYLSEMDEFKTMTEKKLTEITELCDDMSKHIKYGVANYVTDDR